VAAGTGVVALLYIVLGCPAPGLHRLPELVEQAASAEPAELLRVVRAVVAGAPCCRRA
jgi:hypothetical protein